MDSLCFAPLRWRTVFTIVLLAVVTTAQEPSWCSTSRGLGGEGQNGLEFKILPMGASIVYGLMSSDGNGFRLGLQNLLEENGTQATMVGTQWSGDMSDNHHEAYEAVTIESYNNKSYHSGAYDLNPNVILIHIGTNDCWFVKNENGTGAAIRFGYLLDSIYEKAPDALVLASTLIKNSNEWENRCLEGLNSHLPDTVDAAAAKGQQVRLVDMWDVVPEDQLQEDGTHPTDYGYQLMAHQWYDALVNATSEMCVEQAARVTATSSAATSSTARPTVTLAGGGPPSTSPSAAASSQDGGNDQDMTNRTSTAGVLSAQHALWLAGPLLAWALTAL